KQVRARQAATGEPYAEAARHVGKTVSLDTIPAATVPAPVAVMMARHVDAAALHLGKWHALAAEDGGPEASRVSERAQKRPLDEVSSDLFGRVRRVQEWSERTAVAAERVRVHADRSGSDRVDPDPFGSGTEAQRRAYALLYPGRHLWCASGPG